MPENAAGWVCPKVATDRPEWMEPIEDIMQKIDDMNNEQVRARLKNIANEMQDRHRCDWLSDEGQAELLL